jgi:hypothetical protein
VRGRSSPAVLKKLDECAFMVVSEEPVSPFQDTLANPGMNDMARLVHYGYFLSGEVTCGASKSGRLLTSAITAGSDGQVVPFAAAELFKTNPTTQNLK